MDRKMNPPIETWSLCMNAVCLYFCLCAFDFQFNHNDDYDVLFLRFFKKQYDFLNGAERENGIIPYVISMVERKKNVEDVCPFFSFVFVMLDVLRNETINAAV